MRGRGLAGPGAEFNASQDRAHRKDRASDKAAEAYPFPCCRRRRKENKSCQNAAAEAVVEHLIDLIADGLWKAGDFASAVARFGCFSDLGFLSRSIWLRADVFGDLGGLIHNGLFIFWC